jgi:hypothetical protein
MFTQITFAKETAFLYEKDNSLVNSNILDSLTTNKDIQTSKLFMQQATKLDFVSMALNIYVKNSLDSIHFLKGLAKEGFSKQRGQYSRDFSYDGSSGFSSEDDVFYITYSADNLGMPTKPMKETCDLMLRSMDMNLGERTYIYYNEVLDKIRHSYSEEELDSMVKLIKENMIFTIRLSSSFRVDGKANSYYFTCSKMSDSGKTHYSKNVFPD